MRAAEVKNKRVSLALEDQAKIEPAAAFHKRRYAAQAHARMQMRDAEAPRGLPHGGKHFLRPAGGHAFLETRREKQPHASRSAALFASRRVPAPRALAVSRFIRRPARSAAAASSPYSAAK